MYNMKLHVFSDLHCERSPWVPPPDVCDGRLADIALLAGDIHTQRRAPAWAAKYLKGLPVVMIGGNHESYNGSLYADIAETRKICRMLSSDRSNPLVYLEREVFESPGLRVLGATLWTDFALDTGAGTSVDTAMWHASRNMNDFRIISIPSDDPLHFRNSRAFRPEDALRIHIMTVKWLTAELEKPFDGKTVVMTHHAPSEKSISEQYRGDVLNPIYASNMEPLIEKYRPALWVHGHMHMSFDYRVGDTRVVCNPRGYAGYEVNPDFNPELVAEI